MLRHILGTTVLLTVLLTPVSAQWIAHRAAGVPRTRDGKPNLVAPTPRLNGKPDFSGLWQTDQAAPGEIERMLPGIGIFTVPGDDPTTFSKYFFNVLADFKPEEITLSPEATRIHQQRLASGAASDNTANCLPGGVPMGDLLPSPRRFVQTPALLVILYEGINPPRQIHTDGRALPVDPQPSWLGYSIGKWEGETLVIDTIGLIEKGQLDGLRHPYSPDVRITERMRRRDFGHMEVQVTIQDPKFYSKTITFKYTQTLVPDDDLLEWICTENEKDLAHMRTP